MECEGALDDDDLRRVDMRVVLGTETRVRDKVVGRHGHGLSARALQLVDHREQVVEVKLHSAQRARLRRPIGGFWVKMVAVMGGYGLRWRPWLTAFGWSKSYWHA